MKDRSTYIGSGDIAAVAGVSPYSNALDVWAKKTGMVPESEQTPPMRVGVALEQPIIRELYAEPRGLVIEQPGWVGHPDVPHFGATVDAIAINPEGWKDGPEVVERVVEAKVVGTHMGRRWGTVDEPALEAVPADVSVQVQWQFFCTGKELADVVALLGTDLRVWEVRWDEEMIENLHTVADRFWQRVVDRVAPEITAEGAGSAREIIEALYPRQTKPLAEMTPTEFALVEQYIAARDAAKAAKSEKDRLGAAITAAIAEREGVLGDGLKATWKAGDNGTTAWKALALSLNPSEAQIEEYTGAASRKLDVRRVKARK